MPVSMKPYVAALLAVMVLGSEVYQVAASIGRGNAFVPTVGAEAERADHGDSVAKDANAFVRTVGAEAEHVRHGNSLARGLDMTSFCMSRTCLLAVGRSSQRTVNAI